MSNPSILGPFNWYSCFWSGVFPGNDVGRRGLSNLETKYFGTKHYSSLTPYTTAKWDAYKKAQKRMNKTYKYDRHVSYFANYFSLLGWWQSIYNLPWIHHTAHAQKSSCWNCVKRNYWYGRRTRNRNTTWKVLTTPNLSGGLVDHENFKSAHTCEFVFHWLCCATEDQSCTKSHKL